MKGLITETLRKVLDNSNACVAAAGEMFISMFAKVENSQEASDAYQKIRGELAKLYSKPLTTEFFTAFGDLPKDKLMTVVSNPSKYPGIVDIVLNTMCNQSNGVPYGERIEILKDTLSVSTNTPLEEVLVIIDLAGFLAANAVIGLFTDIRLEDVVDIFTNLIGSIAEEEDIEYTDLDDYEAELMRVIDILSDLDEEVDDEVMLHTLQYPGQDIPPYLQGKADLMETIFDRIDV